MSNAKKKVNTKEVVEKQQVTPEVIGKNTLKDDKGNKSDEVTASKDEQITIPKDDVESQLEQNKELDKGNEITSNNDDQTTPIKDDVESEQERDKELDKSDEVISSDDVKRDDKTKSTKVDVDKTTKDVPMKVDDIYELILDNTKSFDEKLDIIIGNGIPEFKTLAARLKSYAESMSIKSTMITPSMGASKNYDLYTLIVSVASTEEYENFSVKFDLINLMFINYGEDAFSQPMLQRFDFAWKNGDRTLAAYQNLVFVIGILADKSTRSENRKPGMLELAFDKKKTNLPELVAENIIKYYS